MQRIPTLAIALAFFASVFLTSCCTPCKQRAEARKAAARAAYGEGNAGVLPEPAVVAE